MGAFALLRAGGLHLEPDVQVLKLRCGGHLRSQLVAQVQGAPKQGSVPHTRAGVWHAPLLYEVACFRPFGVADPRSVPLCHTALLLARCPQDSRPVRLDNALFNHIASAGPWRSSLGSQGLVPNHFPQGGPFPCATSKSAGEGPPLARQAHFQSTATTRMHPSEILLALTVSARYVCRWLHTPAPNLPVVASRRLPERVP